MDFINMDKNHHLLYYVTNSMYIYFLILLAYRRYLAGKRLVGTIYQPTPPARAGYDTRSIF